jgi:hypothetical protein
MTHLIYTAVRMTLMFESYDAYIHENIILNHHCISPKVQWKREALVISSYTHFSFLEHTTACRRQVERLTHAEVYNTTDILVWNL